MLLAAALLLPHLVTEPPPNAVKLMNPGVVYRPDVASATTRPWVNANGWRLQRGAPQPFYYDVKGDAAALAAAEAFAWQREAAIHTDAGGEAVFARMLAFLQTLDPAPGQPLANLGVIDDGSAATGEAMNLLVRRNLLFRIESAPDPALSVNIKPDPGANPSEFAQKVRQQVTDEKRMVRLYGSEVVIARLTGEGARARLQLINYGPRPVNGLRVRVLGSYDTAKAAAFDSPDLKLQDYALADGGTEFTVPELKRYAAIDLTATGAQFIYETAPFPSVHASTVVELRNGDLLAAWFGGSAEGKPDVAIWTSRKTAGKWSPPAELAREPQIACYNPVFFYTRDRRLWFYYKFGPHPSSWSAARRFSDDDGKTWSPIEHLPAGLYGPIRAKPLIMEDGTVVSGTSVESYGTWAAWIERSTDNGKTFTRIGPIPAPSIDGIIQPSVVSLGGKHLRFYARSTAKIGKVCVSDSLDAGLTWSPAHPIDVPNPNSGIDAVALSGRRVVLVYNDTPKGRTPLNLAVSADGEHFRMFRTLESEPGEYSYPAMVQANNGDLLITYTWNRKKIRFLRLPLSAIPN